MFFSITISYRKTLVSYLKKLNTVMFKVGCARKYNNNNNNNTIYYYTQYMAAESIYLYYMVSTCQMMFGISRLITKSITKLLWPLVLYTLCIEGEKMKTKKKIQSGWLYGKKNQTVIDVL